MTVTVEISDEVYREAEAIAKAEHSSVDEVISAGFSEHLAVWQRLKDRAARGSREAFLRVLDKVPDVPPVAYETEPR